MSERFQGLVKFPTVPVAKLLSQCNVTLMTRLDAPANAPADVVLAELDQKGALVDLLRLLAELHSVFTPSTNHTPILLKMASPRAKPLSIPGSKSTPMASH